MGRAHFWLRGHQLDGLWAQVEASIKGHLIRDQGLILGGLRAAFASLQARYSNLAHQGTRRATRSSANAGGKPDIPVRAV